MGAYNYIFPMLSNMQLTFDGGSQTFVKEIYTVLNFYGWLSNKILC